MSTFTLFRRYNLTIVEAKQKPIHLKELRVLNTNDGKIGRMGTDSAFIGNTNRPARRSLEITSTLCVQQIFLQLYRKCTLSGQRNTFKQDTRMSELLKRNVVYRRETDTVFGRCNQNTIYHGVPEH